MRFALPIFVLCLAGACAQFPELDARISPALENAPAPDLVPLGPIVARANSDAGQAEAAVQAISPRLASLQARAARLRGPVIPPAVRTRMLRGIR